MKLFELLQMLNTDIDLSAPVQQPANTQQPEPVQSVPACASDQTPGPMEYNGIEQLLQQILTSQQSSANAVSQLTSTLQAAQVGMGVQTQPAEDRANMATARIINPMFGRKE